VKKEGRRRGEGRGERRSARSGFVGVASTNNDEEEVGRSYYYGLRTSAPPSRVERGGRMGKREKEEELSILFLIPSRKPNSRSPVVINRTCREEVGRKRR
jgi:hypothetical protein